MRRRVRQQCVWAGSWVTNLEVRYVYDGNLVVQERHYQVFGASLAPVRTVTYMRGPDLSGTWEGAGGIGGLLARTEEDAAGVQASSTTYYHADGNGNVTMLINTNQAIVARYLYDPFGSVLSLSGSLAEANLYRFSTKECHPNSALVYYLYRFYDPSLQRWPNRDPIGEKGGLNLYGFVKNSPANYWDADGRLIGIIIVGGVVIGVEGVYLYCTRESVCLRYVEANLQYAANLVDNMPEYGNEPGSTTIEGQGTPQDALKHCIAACEVTKHPGLCRSANRAYVILQGREGTDPLSQGDMLNNQAGFDVGRGGGDCRAGCQQALRDGLLFGVNQQDGSVFRFPRQP